jgi:hypothetical protein
MSSKRMFFVLLGCTVLLSLAIVGSLVLGNMYLVKQSKKLTDLKVQDRVVEEQQAALKQANKDIAKYADLEKVSKAVVPQDKDQAKAVLDVVTYANASGIKIKSITFPSSNLGSKAAPTAPAPATDDSSKKSGDAAATPAAPVTPPISQAKPIEGIKGVYSLEMNIVPDDTQNITYYQLLDFLTRLENNRRTAQITQIKITPFSSDKQNPVLSFALTINIFVKPS